MPLILPFPSFFTESGGPEPASQLDSNFAAVNTSLTTEQQITAATTTDLGSVQSNNVLINFSGSPTVSAFGSSAITSQPFFNIRWAGTGTTTLQNSSSIAIVGGANLTISSGAQGRATYLGSGNWAYAAFTTPTSGFPGASTTLASATTTDLGTSGSFVVDITGTTTITSFGSSASTTTPIYYLTFAGALLLTYNATSLIMPTSANITTASGDTAVAQYLGSGNWAIIEYQRKSGAPLVGGELILLGTATASNSASLNFTSLITSAYDYYFFILKDIVLASSTTFAMRYSVNNGSTYLTTSVYEYQNSAHILSSTAINVTQGNTGSLLITSVNGGTALDGKVELFNPLSTLSGGNCGINWKIIDNGINDFFEGYGVFTSTSTGVNAVQFLATTGNITSGTIEMYGVKNT